MTIADTNASNNGRGSDAWSRSWTHFRVDRRSLGDCRVTFDHPPINTITARTVAELAELVDLIEQDPDLNVVVFDSANPEFFLAHYDTEGDPAKTASMPPGSTGMHPWLDLTARLSRAPVVSIASLRGRARGAGREFALACDIRLAGDKAILAQFAEGYGYVNRVVSDDQLEQETDRLACRLASFDKQSIAETKAFADTVSLPDDEALPPG